MYIHELWCHQNQLTELVAATDHLLLHQVTAILINDRVCLPLSVGFASWLLLGPVKIRKLYSTPLRSQKCVFWRSL